ncbi:MAG: carbohydrate kinase [Proteobacteria bacterium]|nr:carbohydrate kinase [Pseudomonadota bacterium]
MGVDNGGSMVKAVIFDELGSEIAASSARLAMLTPQAGFTERDMDELWRINCQVIREALRLAGDIRIAGVACSGHGKGLYLWGRDDKPCGAGIVSTDSRASIYPQQWAADGTAERVFAKTFQQILACQPVSLLRWLKDQRPELIANIKWIFAVKDFIRFKLTGEAFAELTDYSGSNLFNVRDGGFDRELLAEFGIDELYDALPPLKQSTDFCGAVSERAARETGLAPGTPLAGGMFDIDACAIAMNIVNQDHVCVIAGTWSINEYIARAPVLDKSVMMNSLYCLPGYYLIEECSPTSASNFAWFVDMFMGEEKRAAEQLKVNVFDHCCALAQKVEPDDSAIVFLPYLFGSNYDPQAKACLIGVDSHHSRGQIIRAVLEGIVFCHRVHLEKLLAQRSHTDAVRLAGGAANSPFWAQMFADVFKLPVDIVATRELGALGCAMAAAVAAGVYRDLPQAAAQMAKIKCRIEPDPSRSEIYERKFARYQRVAGALAPLWADVKAPA